MDFEGIAELIKNGSVGSFPTDTVYGLGAHPFQDKSLDRIFEIKGREGQSPLALHISSLLDVYKFSMDVPGEFGKIANIFWPGPLAIILPASPLVPPQACLGQTVSFRYPKQELFLNLAKLVGVPICATSANRSGSLSSICPLDVQSEIGQQIDFLLDGGFTPERLDSTIIDLTSKPFSILRVGAIKREELEAKSGYHFQLKGPVLAPLKLTLAIGSPDFLLHVLSTQGEVIALSPDLSLPFPFRPCPIDDKLFFLLARLQKEGKEIFIHSVWSPTSQIYQRLKIRAKKIFQEGEKADAC